MKNQIAKTENQVTIHSLLNDEKIKKRFHEILGKRSTTFMTSIIQVMNSSDLLKDADPMSVLNASLVSATLDLPLNNALGYAYIIPFNDRNTNRVVAQFQIGYKGLIQLAQRSGQFLRISTSPVYEGQLKESNPLTGFVFDWNARKSDKLIGYVAYFKLINGFEKELFMTVEQLEQHGKKYSQTYRKGFGLWKTDFDAMASKTVLKLLLARFAPLSIEMQHAVIADQGEITDIDVNYVDNQQPVVDKEMERVDELVNQCMTADELAELKNQIKSHHKGEFPDKFEPLFVDQLKRINSMEEFHKSIK